MLCHRPGPIGLIVELQKSARQTPPSPPLQRLGNKINKSLCTPTLKNKLCRVLCNKNTCGRDIKYLNESDPNPTI